MTVVKLSDFCTFALRDSVLVVSTEMGRPQRGVPDLEAGDLGKISQKKLSERKQERRERLEGPRICANLHIEM